MKKLLFLLLLLLNCHSIFAQKNFYGAGISHSIVRDFRERSIVLTGYSLNYERELANKWSCSIAMIGQKSKAIDLIVNDFSSPIEAFKTFEIKTTHRFFGLENLYTYHPNGFGEGAYYGIGFNVKSYKEINTKVTPNTPSSLLIGTTNRERNIALTFGYNESFDNGFRFNPFGNFAFDLGGESLFPIEFRLGCNFMFSD
jgi:hypothetical protein